MTNLFKKSDIRCQVCLLEYHSSDVIQQGLKACPNCGTMLPPQLIAEDGYVKVNWQELRVLAIYAKRWSQIFDLNIPADREYMQALQNILGKFEKYRPRNGQPLTLPNDTVVISREPPPPNQQGEVRTIPKLPEQKPKPRGIPSPFFGKSGLPPTD